MREAHKKDLPVGFTRVQSNPKLILKPLPRVHRERIRNSAQKVIKHLKKTGQYIPGAYVNQYGLARKVDKDGDAEAGCVEKKLMKFDFTPEKIMLLLSNERLRIFEDAWKNPEREEDSLDCVEFT